jgi:phosphoserine phosphatase RsbU/P
MFCPHCGVAMEANEKFCSQCGKPAVSPATDYSRPDPAAWRRPRRADSIRAFWQRLSDGIELHQLWAQFQSEARASYRLYSKEVDWNRAQGESGFKRSIRVVKALFWAMVLKLSPGRRVLFVVALALLVFPGFQIHSGNFNFEMPNVAFLGALALLILLALELADRVTMKRDLEIAREIQSWLMPSQPPQAPGVDIAFATRAANTVAGDYYDAFFLPCSAARGETAPANKDRSRLLLVVADVAGKSIPAALLMATLQASLRTLAALSPSLPDLVQRLNGYACDQNLGRQRFTTAFIAEWDIATGCFSYVNAGHNWPVLRRRSGTLERLQAGGLPLGIKSDLRYECGSTKLDPGDLLLTFTDGLIEAENDKEEEYGEERMLANIVAAPGATAKDLLSRIMTSVDAFVGFAPQHDDITCLVLRAGNPS